MDLKGRVVIVTGSSSGIGRAVALRFAKEKAKLVLNYRANKKGGEEVLKEVKKLGREAILVRADVSKPKDVARLFRTAMQKFKRVDILVNNAAMSAEKVSFMEASYGDIKEMLDNDLVSVMLCSQAATRIMRTQGCGKILNTSSVRGAEHGGRTAVYSAAKAGVNNFTKTFAKDVSPEIQVNAVAPGFTTTMAHEHHSKEMTDSFIRQTYLKRWITPDEIADAFIFLAKNDAITGQVIYVDAGFTLK